jgi:cytochrome c peroxidase
MRRLGLWIAVAGTAWAQDLGSLKRVRVQPPSNLSQYVRDQAALVVLGKSLFWDVQAGGDGRVACATCHFHAGADHRLQNQLVNPLSPFAPNQTLRMADFPFHLLANPNDGGSAVLRDTALRAGSAGVPRRIFVEVTPGSALDDGFDAGDAVFSVDGVNVRRVTKRNTPTVINAVFNVRNFWDGRARDIFTGFTPFGESDRRQNALRWIEGRLVPERVRLERSSLASQAVGPANDSVEMSYEGRSWPALGRKMLSLRPLARQRVAPDDSVLGRYANPSGPGLLPAYTYLDLVQAAFQPDYWNSPQLVAADGTPLSGRTFPMRARSARGQSGEFTQAEFNFALFWGLAIQGYEAMLISDDSPFDRFSEGNPDALSSLEQSGLGVFRGRGGCTNCHTGPEFTVASFTGLASRGAVRRLSRGAETDQGFFRIGVRPVFEDPGLGGVDGFGNPLSILASQRPADALGIDGAFKTPTLRNVEFTGPYFHNGGQATLDQVVEFYNRGGDFRQGGNLGPGIRQRTLSAEERRALVAFLRSLSDDRVRFERAPFDHPELCVPIGHREIQPGILQPDASDARFSMTAVDQWAALPAVGRNGNPVPLQTFEELLLGIGEDGSRAHTLKDPCPAR